MDVIQRQICRMEMIVTVLTFVFVSKKNISSSERGSNISEEKEKEENHIQNQ